jgi:hypothetical protein
MIACVSLYDPNYRALAEKTLYENRQEYCQRHGYKTVFEEIEMKGNSVFEMVCGLGFRKVRLILQTFERFQDCNRIWFGDCDGIVMNMTVALEDLLAPYPEDILTGSDFNGPNCGAMILRRTPQVIAYLQDILSGEGQYLHEQDYIWKNPKSFIRSVPQRIINSYDCTLPNLGVPDQESVQYQRGDFFMHWPAQTLETRLQCYEKWKGEVVDGD